MSFRIANYIIYTYEINNSNPNAHKFEKTSVLISDFINVLEYKLLATNFQSREFIQLSAFMYSFLIDTDETIYLVL